MFKTFLTTILAAYLALCGHALAGCAQSATITAETDVYSETPVFVTGNGWTFGTHVTTLQPGTPIDICGEKEVGVLIDKKLWYWIEYRLDHEEGNGWIFSGRTSLGFLDTPEPRKLAQPFGLGLISAAHAQGAADEGLPGGDGTSGVTASLVYSLAFVAIILGMVAKTIYDALEAGRSLVVSEIVRNLARSFVVAPMTYLAFLQFGQFSIANDANIVVGFCFAFQNGFFWQTVLERPTPATATA